MNTRVPAMAIGAAAILSVAAAIDLYAHGWWTYTRTYDDETWNAYVCTAEHRDYRVVGIDTRSPLIDFPAMGVDPASVTDGTLLWRVGYSAGRTIERNINIRWSERRGMWRWHGVPWALIDSHGGGHGRWFAIEWHTTDATPATTAIHLDSIMDAYDWVVACQAGEIAPVLAAPPDDSPKPDDGG